MFKRLLPAYLLTFVNVLGFSILLPILPFVVEDFGAPKWVYGLLLSLYSAFQFLGAPYLGALSDSKGRKPILFISQAGTLLSWVVFLVALYLPDTPIWGYALPLWIIAFSRILDGVTGGNTSVANAYISDITTKEEKSTIFGYLGGIVGLGLVIGPGIGGWTAASSLGHAGTMIAAIVISTIALLLIWLWLKESHPKEKRTAPQKQQILKSVFVLRRIRSIQPKPIIKLLFLMKLFFSTMIAFYMGTIALFLIDTFGFDEKELGLFMLAAGIFIAFNQAVVSQFFIRKMGGFKTLVLGLMLSVVGLVAITLTENLYLFVSFYYILNLGFSLCFPTFNSLIAIHANPQKQGEIMGVSESINSLAMAAFPILAAAMYSWFGHDIYYGMSVLTLIGLIIALKGGKKLAAAKKASAAEA